MSATSSEIVTDALLEHCSGLSQSQKFLLSEVHGATAEELFVEMMRRAKGERDIAVNAGGGRRTLRGVELGEGRVVIPYLVLRERAEPGFNRGSQAFNGTLRDWFDRGEDDEVRILVTFDEEPIETQLSAMDDRLPDTVLSLSALVDRLTEASVENVPKEVAELVAAVADHVKGLPDGEVRARDVAQLAQAYEGWQGRGLAEAGEDLGRLRFFLPDPDLEPGRVSDQLRLSAGMRAELEGWWRAPDQDFEGKVRDHYDDSVAPKLIDAAGVSGIDVGGLTRKELSEHKKSASKSRTKKIGFAPTQPVLVGGASPQVSAWPGPKEFAAVFAGGPEFEMTVSLNRPLSGPETVHLITYEAKGDARFAPSEDRKVRASEDAGTDRVTFAVDLASAPERGGWRFFTVAVSRTKTFRTSPEQIARVALYSGPGTCAWEAGLEVDETWQAFVVRDIATLEARSGDDFERRDVDPEELPEVDRVVMAPGFDGPVPLVGGSIDTGGAEAEPLRTPSPAHYALRLHAEGEWPSGAERARVLISGDRQQILAGERQPEDLEDAELPRGSLRRIESDILTAPANTAFVVRDDGNLDPLASVDEIKVDLLAAPWEAFLARRAEYFTAVRDQARGAQWPSTLRVPPGESAHEYVVSYLELLDAIPDGDEWVGEFEKVLLVDLVHASGDDWWLAPTHPLHVAHVHRMDERLSDWLDASADNLLPGDLANLSTRWIAPFLRIGDAWCESVHAPYPWRRYRPLDAETSNPPDSYVSRYVAKRIEAFLEVHPGYASSARTLRLSFINPGTAEHVLAALRQLILLREKRLETVPALELRLLAAPADMARTGAALEHFTGMTQHDDVPDWRAAELMRRLTFTKVELSNWITDRSFSHITFAENFVKSGDLADYQPAAQPTSIYASGLAPAIERLSRYEAHQVTFVNGVWTGPAGSASEDEIVRGIRRTNEVARGAGNTAIQRGTARGVQVKVQLAELRALYERSAWVVHLDRHIGLELFRAGEDHGQDRYILDYTDQENLDESGFDAVTATASVQPYLMLISRAFEELAEGERLTPEDAAELLGWLNTISGRWALQLIKTNVNQVKEKLGIIIAYRALLEHEGLLDDDETLHVVVALDELVRVTPSVGLPMTDGWMAKYQGAGSASDDLLVLSLPLSGDEPLVVTGRVVEVKYRTGGVDSAPAAEQVRRTHELLASIFGADTEPGHALRGRELARLLSSYLLRLAAFGRMPLQRLEDERVIRALDAVARGSFQFSSSFAAPDGEVLAGDFATVEPRFPEPYHRAASVPSPGSGLPVGRIRIGSPQLGEGEGRRPPAAAADVGDQARDARTEVPPAAGVQEEASSQSAAREEQARTDDPAANVGPSDFEVGSDRLRSTADELDEILGGFGLPVQTIDYRQATSGPNLIRFRFRMERSGTIAQVEARARDIQRELGSQDPILIGQDPPFVTLDVPREDRQPVAFEALTADLASAIRQPGELPILLGVDSRGAVGTADLSKLPHLLIAGTTGSGKSVFLTSIIGSLAAAVPASRLQIRVVDIKGVDYTALANLPHLGGATPIDRPAEAIDLLRTTIEDETAARRALFREVRARQITEYYQQQPDESGWPPQIVIVVDEYAQLLGADRASRQHLEGLIQQYAQFARAFGIYLVLATQRPSVDVVTGPIKANLPSRCVFQLPSVNDSRTVIDGAGAEALLGEGDMLFYNDGRLRRYQAPNASPEDVLASALR